VLLERIAKLTGMIGSRHDAEALSGGGLGRPARFRTSEAACAFCLRRADLLSQWERQFVASLPGFRRISTKQEDVLRRMVLKVAVEEGWP
jgi:hypothetical protein